MFLILVITKKSEYKNGILKHMEQVNNICVNFPHLTSHKEGGGGVNLEQMPCVQIYDLFVFSFLDDAFRKNLESALRFGNPLLVQDMESYDAILNPVLNREVRRTGGRVLITLGDQDIDLSPSFTIFLSTRDPTVRLYMLYVPLYQRSHGKIIHVVCSSLPEIPR